jgi:hypothetical protein
MFIDFPQKSPANPDSWEEHQPPSLQREAHPEASHEIVSGRSLSDLNIEGRG